MDSSSAITEQRETNSSSLLIRMVMHPAFIPLCIVSGLLIRFFVATLMPIEPASDAAWYVTRAQELVAGAGYQEDGHPTAYWPVGWPAILAGVFWIFDSIPLSVLVINLTSAGIILWLVVWFARQTTGRECVARLALLAYAVYPNHIAYSGAANTETIYTAFAMAAFALLIAGRKQLVLLLLSGLLFGIGTLIKPQTLAFPIGGVIALALVYREVSWLSMLRAGLMVYLVLLAVVLPWSMRNQSVFGEFVLVSTNGGVALLMGANDQITGGHFDYEDTPVFEQLGIPFSDRVSRQIEMNHRQKAAAVAWIKENPVDWVGWMPKKVALLWIKDTDGFWAFDRSYPNAAPIIKLAQIVNQLYYALILLLSLFCAYKALGGLFRQHESHRRLGLLFCMPVFVSLLAAVFTGQIRYHFAAMPFLFIAAAWASLYIYSSWSNKSAESAA